MPDQTFPATWIQRGKRLFVCSRECGHHPSVLGYATFVETWNPGEFDVARCSICDKLLSFPAPPPATTARDRVLAGYRDEIDVYTEARELAIHHNRTRDIKQLGDIIAAIKYMIDQIELSAPSKITGGLNADNR